MPIILILTSGLAFILYGLLCLLTDHMKSEFRRYGLSHFRKLTGALELLGGLGLFAGLYYTPLLYISSAGLSLLMFLGAIVRLKTKDPLIQLLPAFVLMAINLIIFLSID
jgi:hypothetical protein